MEAAADKSLKIDGKKLSKRVEHVIILLSIKNSQHIEVWTGMTKEEFHLALAKNQKVFCPYKIASSNELDADDIQIDQDVSLDLFILQQLNNSYQTILSFF